MAIEDLPEWSEQDLKLSRVGASVSRRPRLFPDAASSHSLLNGVDQPSNRREVIPCSQRRAFNPSVLHRP
jgi:hypothetical protein